MGPRPKSSSKKFMDVTNFILIITINIVQIKLKWRIVSISHTISHSSTKIRKLSQGVIYKLSQGVVSHLITEQES